jgi:NTP pyrophosphatase (non-canonical NTP hydrolase)
MFDWFSDTFYEQYNLQKKIKKVEEPNDLINVVDMYGAATGMIIEIGEMLQTDTRWKKYITGSKKKAVIDNDKFLEELSDVYIYLMNVLIYQGVTLDEFKRAVRKKQEIVRSRFDDKQDCGRGT